MSHDAVMVDHVTSSFTSGVEALAFLSGSAVMVTSNKTHLLSAVRVKKKLSGVFSALIGC